MSVYGTICHLLQLYITYFLNILSDFIQFLFNNHFCLLYGCSMDGVWIQYGQCMNRYNRLVIYPQDVAFITGRSDRYGRMIIKRIKKHLGKEPHQFVTIKEFATYMDIELVLIEGLLFGDQIQVFYHTYFCVGRSRYTYLQGLVSLSPGTSFVGDPPCI